MEYKNAWLIIAKANLHVGNENVSNYGLIDKAIQRDIVTNLPCINSSSLKGAINEYTTMVCTTSITPQQRISIFGVDKNDKSKTQKGNTVFLMPTFWLFRVPMTIHYMNSPLVMPY